MNGNIKPQRKKTIVLLLATIAIAVYLISIKLTYPVFQNTRLIDPLAEIHSLPALYYIAIAMIAAAGFICLIYRIQNKSIHLLLLILLAIMLWYTPYHLAGFVYLPDGPWHVGVALHMPEVLAGEPIAFSGYAWDFPSSFIFHYLFINLLGIEPVSYISTLFPFLCSCLFVLLCYTFICRLFNPRVALLSLLLAIPGLHYMHLHPSPHAVGSLLVLTALVLLPRRDVPSRVLTFLTIAAVVICHPISPLILLVFLGAALVASLSRKVGTMQATLAAMVVVCLAGWFFWPLVPLVTGQAATIPGQVARMAASMFPEELATAQQYLFGTPFIYSTIYRLNKGIYILYAAIAAILLAYILIATYLREHNIQKWISKLGGLSRNQIFLAVSLPLFLILTFLLAEKAHDLIERSLTFIILALSCIIASMNVNLDCLKVSKKILRPILLMLVLFLTVSFPTVAYSIDAYSSFPESEEAGLKFLAGSVSLDGKTLGMNSGHQLVLYTPYITPAKLSWYGQDASVYALRSTGYYKAAIRYDLSFDNNRFTQCLDAVKVNSEYDRIYSSPSTEIYLRNFVN